MNHTHDLTPPEYIKPPPRMPNTEWDKLEQDNNDRRKGTK